MDLSLYELHYCDYDIAWLDGRCFHARFDSITPVGDRQAQTSCHQWLQDLKYIISVLLCFLPDSVFCNPFEQAYFESENSLISAF